MSDKNEIEYNLKKSTPKQFSFFSVEKLHGRKVINFQPSLFFSYLSRSLAIILK